jgi:RNA recognition motif-containing protein
MSKDSIPPSDTYKKYLYYSFLICFSRMRRCIKFPIACTQKKEDRMNIYVGNLAEETTEEELNEAFGAFGQVSSAKIITDKYTGTSRGFGFIEMPAKAEAESAISGLNGTELKGQTLTVNEARPRPDRGRGGRGGGRRY